MAAEIAVGYTNYTVEQITKANVNSKEDQNVDISDVRIVTAIRKRSPGILFLIYGIRI